MAQGKGAPGATLREPTPTGHDTGRPGLRLRVFWLVVTTTVAALGVLIVLMVVQGREVDQIVRDSQGLIGSDGYGIRGEIPSTFVQQDTRYAYGDWGEIPDIFGPRGVSGQDSPGGYGSRGEIPDTFATGS